MKTKAYLFLSLLVSILIADICKAQTKTAISPPDNNKALDTHAAYVLNVEGANPPYQVRINDIPLISSGVRGPMTFFINSAIGRSGLQTLKTVQAKGSGTALLTVTAIRRLEKGIAKKDTIVFSGKASGNFQATVPYTLPAWEQGQELVWEKITLGTMWFEKGIQLLKARKGDEFMKSIAQAKANGYTSNYMSAEEARKHSEQWTDFINKGGFDVQDISGYKVEVVGNGKLLHLVNKDLDGGIAIKTPKGQEIFIDIYLWMPPGKTALEPAIINFKQITKDYRRLLN